MRRHPGEKSIRTLNSSLSGFWQAVRELDSDEPYAKFKHVFVYSLITLALAVTLYQVSRALSGATVVVTALAVASQVVMGISASVSAAALIEVFAGVRVRWQKDEDRMLFCKLFGIGEDEKVAIVLSRFPTGGTQSNDKPPVLRAELKTKARKGLRETNEQVHAFADVKAAGDLLVAFSELHLPLPRLERDDHIVKQLKGNSPDYDAYIAIGLGSNELTIEANQRQDDLFRIFGESTENLKLKLARRNPKSALPTDQWSEEEYVSDRETYDFILIARTKLSAKKKLIVVGGLEAQGTEKAGEYIRLHWKDLLRWTDHASKHIESTEDGSVVGNRFAGVVRVWFNDDRPPQCEEVVVPEDRS